MSTALRIALAQVQFWVGDVDGNVERMLARVATARDAGADLIAFPELALLGYPPDDLLLRSGLPAAVARGLERLAGAAQGIAIVLGHPQFADGACYNAASVLADGCLQASYRKQRLPNYGVFDEKRHFRAGSGPCVVAIKGRRIALSICEDAWGPQPAAQAKAAGAELLLNINASPFALGKAALRRQTLAARVAETGLPLLYVNCVGGQDELVFDGDSMYLAADGRVQALGQCFTEALLYVDMQPDGSLSSADGPAQPMPDEALVYQALVCGIRDYVNRNGFKGVLLGLSGGIDSALTLALAADALGPERVWAVGMPSRYTADISVTDAAEQAHSLGVRYEEIPIEPLVDAFGTALSTQLAGTEPDITEENLQSRSRGLLLMALSNKFQHMVLATGNKSEMATGYATLYGDMCGGFAPLKDVYKTWVYRLANYRNTQGVVIPERVITRAPSAELRADQVDQDSLPPYDELDAIIRAYVEGNHSSAQIVAQGFDAATVQRVTGMIRRNEYKRRQAPPGPKVTPCAFGRERRYPLTAVYGEL